MVTEKLIEHLKSKGLSKSEIHVVTLIYEGYSNKQIAEKRCSEVSTIKMHVTHIHQKLKLKNRIEIFNFCLRFMLPEFYKGKLKEITKEQHQEKTKEINNMFRQLNLPVGIKW